MPSMVHIKGVVSLMMPLLLAFVAIPILAMQETAQLAIPTGQIFFGHSWKVVDVAQRNTGF